MLFRSLSDGLITTNRQMDALLTQFDIPHSFETYDGDHNNRVKERFETKVLPFFSGNLMFAQAVGPKTVAKKTVAKKSSK